ncbi:DUF5799 family protein [Natrialbaceae archaeon A-arb3/5]
MSDSSWTDQIVGERMTVDQEFTSRIENSEFSNQQWSLIMTATEFEIEQPGDPEQARLVANTDSVEQIIPELDNIPEGMGPVKGDSGTAGGKTIVDSIKNIFKTSDATGKLRPEDKLRIAEDLTQEYADELQAHLESNGRWDSVRESVAEEQ